MALHGSCIPALLAAMHNFSTTDWSKMCREAVYIYIFVSNEQVLTYTAHDIIFSSAAWFHQNSNRPVPDAFQFLTISRICFEHVWIGLTLCDGLLQADTSCLVRPWKKKWQCSHRSMVATDDPCLTLVGVTSFWLLLYSTYPMLLITFAFDQSWILLSLLLFAVFFWTL